MDNIFKNLKADRKSKIDFFLDSMGLVLIGALSLGYIIFSRRFAELHIQLSFLDFPVFVGEISLFLCLLILAIKWINKPPKFKLWHCFLILYITFVLIKAFSGYFRWSPLAFRHAALFYYPLFAVFGYSFYRKSFFNGNRIVFLILTMMLINGLFIRFSGTNFPATNEYFLLTCCVLAILFIKAYHHRIGRYLFFILLLFIIPYEKFFHTSRTMMIGNIVSGIYIAVALFLVLSIRKRYKVIISIALLVLLSLGITKVCLMDDSVKPFFKLKRLMDMPSEYKELRRIITAKGVEPRIATIIEKINKEGKVGLYVSEDKKSIWRAEVSRKGLGKRQTLPRESNTELKVRESRTALNSDSSDRMPNVFFRLFIWQDLLRELKEQKPFFGFDFGKPFRSDSVEYLYWSAGEWSRDGWIAVHNSYLETIYRAGILGILFIGIIIFMIAKMVYLSIKFKSVDGVLLSGALISWLIAANFLVILELPYNAIPFWSLSGIAIVCLKKIKEDYV